VTKSTQADTFTDSPTTIVPLSVIQARSTAIVPLSVIPERSTAIVPLSVIPARSTAIGAEIEEKKQPATAVR
jgi:hypothetical protein